MVATEELSDISLDNGYDADTDVESQRPPSRVIANYSGREAGGVRGLTREDLSSSVNVVIVKLSDLSICVKTCIVFLFVALLAPLLICDVWFAGSDQFCMNQQNPHLEIAMRELLMVSGIINAGGIAFISIFVCSHNEDRPMTQRMKRCANFTRNMAIRAFTMTWLVLSGVIMEYSASADCKEEANDYLFSRLIFGIIGNLLICLWL